MNTNNNLVEEIKSLLKTPVSSDYTDLIATEICELVEEDLAASADEDYNTDDLRMAIGRAMIEKMGILY